jgi:acetyl esterase/lipase
MAGGAPTVVGGRTLDPALQLLAANAARSRDEPLGSPSEVRASIDAGMCLLSGKARPLVTVEALALDGPAGELPARLYRPRALAQPAPLLLFFHQGGFVVGALDWCEAFCSILADEAGCGVLSVDYRLGPEDRFPAATEDALASWRWVQQNAARLGVDPARVAVGGESAGGNLAAVLCQETHTRGERTPLLQLLIYPWLEGRARLPSRELYAESWPLDTRLMDWFNDNALASPDDADHRWLNPLHTPDLAGLPTTLVFTAGFDPLCDEGAEYVDRLRAAGVDASHYCFDALTHSFLALGAVPACQRAQLDIARAFASRLASAPG